MYGDHYGDTQHGYANDLTFGVTVRPSSNVRVTVSPSLALLHNTIQFVSRAVDPLATATYGRRYVFGDLFQTTLSATTRIEWTFTPLLSLQLYAQPFASAGRFKTFKELSRPGTRDYAVYGRDNGSTVTPVTDPVSRKTVTYTIDPDGLAGPAAPFTIDNPDFRTHSLRGNAVVRWEYKPGSALFFVWQQERSDFFPNEGDFQTRREARQVFGRPSNVFLVKATYWIAR
jgi:hypothetical protein